VTNLVAFLRARLGEDEARATFRKQEPTTYAGFEMDPDQVLREVEAVRAILDLYEAAAIHDDTSLGVATLRTVVKTIAAVYRDHPDYDPAWVMTASG
jgi:Family of unknown function (DUF6221)